jgi:hypothetical protein
MHVLLTQADRIKIRQLKALAFPQSLLLRDKSGNGGPNMGRFINREAEVLHLTGLLNLNLQLLALNLTARRETNRRRHQKEVELAQTSICIQNRRAGHDRSRNLTRGRHGVSRLGMHQLTTALNRRSRSDRVAYFLLQKIHTEPLFRTRTGRQSGGIDGRKGERVLLLPPVPKQNRQKEAHDKALNPHQSCFFPFQISPVMFSYRRLE